MAFWRSRGVLTAEAARRLGERAHVVALAVKGVDDLAVLIRLRESLGRAVQGGWGFERWWVDFVGVVGEEAAAAVAGRARCVYDAELARVRRAVRRGWRLRALDLCSSRGWGAWRPSFGVLAAEGQAQLREAVVRGDEAGGVAVLGDGLMAAALRADWGLFVEGQAAAFVHGTGGRGLTERVLPAVPHAVVRDFLGRVMLCLDDGDMKSLLRARSVRGGLVCPDTAALDAVKKLPERVVRMPLRLVNKGNGRRYLGWESEGGGCVLVNKNGIFNYSRLPWADYERIPGE